MRPPVIAVTRAATSSLLGVDRSRSRRTPARRRAWRGDVDGDDRRSAGDPRALHGIEAHAAAADDDDARAGFHAGGVDDRAQPGQHAAGDQRGDFERHVLRDRNRLDCVDDDVLGEGADAHAVDDRLAAAVVQRACAVEREHFLAEHRRAAGAGGAEAAERISVATTGSPTLRRVTPGPTASTTPAASWP